MRFSLPSIKCSAGPPSLRLLPNSVRCLNSAQRFHYRALDSSRKLGGVGEHLIDSSEKRICRLGFDFRVRVLLKGAVINFSACEKANCVLFVLGGVVSEFNSGGGGGLTL